MTFALGAGDLFDIQAKNEYVDTMIGNSSPFLFLSLSVALTYPLFLSSPAKCFGEYIRLRVENEDEGQENPIDPRLEDIIELMFKRCFEENNYREALGIGRFLSFCTSPCPMGLSDQRTWVSFSP